MDRILALTSLVLFSAISTFGQSTTSQAKAVYKCDEATTCSHRYVNGELLNTISGPNGVAVTAALDESRDLKYFRVRVGVVNGSDKTFDVMPDGFVLDVVNRKMKSLKPIPPEDVERAALRRDFWVNYLIDLSGKSARDRSTTVSKTTDRSSGNIDMYSRNGLTANGTYTASDRSSTTTATSTPDYAAQARAEETIRTRNMITAAQNAQVAQTALRANTLAPGEWVAGTVYFKSATTDEVLVHVVVDGAEYQFKF